MYSKYCEYGCHCLPGGSQQPDLTGLGIPKDEIDRSCYKKSRCYECAEMDGCDSHGTLYDYELYYDSSDPYNLSKRGISCLNEKDSCSRKICECDSANALEISKYSNFYQPQNHFSNGFDFSTCVDTPTKTDPPILKYQKTYWATSDNGSNRNKPSPKCCTATLNYDSTSNYFRKCCDENTYDSRYSDCCNGRVVSIGSC